MEKSKKYWGLAFFIYLIAAVGINLPIWLVLHKQPTTAGMITSFIMLILTIAGFCIVRHKTPDAPRKCFKLLTVLCLLTAWGAALLYTLIGYTLHSQVETRISSAKVVYQAAEAYAQKPDALPLHTFIHQSREPFADEMEADIAKMFSIPNYSYAVVCDDDGNLLYTLVSKGNLQDISAVGKTAAEVQEQMEDIFIGREKAVACYGLTIEQTERK